jgi:hypothetical protein
MEINSSQINPNTIVNSARSTAQSGESETAKKIEAARHGYIKLFCTPLSRGTIIMKRPDNNATSEGVGFGGIIFSKSGRVGVSAIAISEGNSLENQKMYWEIYKARKSFFLKSTGVMSWLVDQNGAVIGRESASDGDQDWIASEINVLKKVKSGVWKLPPGMSAAAFEKEIRSDLSAFWEAHIIKNNGRLLFLISDADWARRGDGRNIFYPSYPDPYFIREFAKFDQSHDWGKLANDVQELNAQIISEHKKLGAVGQNPMPSKIFVMVGPNGSYIVENYYEISKREGVNPQDCMDNEADSIRFLLRQARSAIIGNDQSAKIILRQLLSIANITDPSSAHIYSGSQGAPSKWGWNNTVARACYGVAVLAVDGWPKAESFINSVLNDHKGEYFGEWDGAKNYYFDQSLILQALDLAFIDN